MTSTLRDRASALSTAVEQARAGFAAVEAELAEAQQRAHAALVSGDMRAAEVAQADAAAAREKLAPAREVLATVEAAQRDVAARLQRAEQQSVADQLRDTTDATRLHLHQLLGDALTAARTAQAKLREAVAEETAFRYLQRELHTARVQLGDAEQRSFNVDRERPVDDVLSGRAGPALRALLDTDFDQAVE